MTTDRLTRLIADTEGAGSAVVVMSPHLDDAVLSCGALIAHLAARHLVTVATVFTAAAPPPWSLPARRQAHGAVRGSYPSAGSGRLSQIVNLNPQYANRDKPLLFEECLRQPHVR